MLHRFNPPNHRENHRPAGARRTIAAALLLFAAFGPKTAWARCEYIVTHNWNSGFTANIRIINDGVSAIDGWEIGWSYSDGSRRTNSWNANVTGENPYTATGLTWNSRIEPGAFVEFGVQGDKGIRDGVPNVPVFTGAACATPAEPLPDESGSGNPSDAAVSCEISYANVWNDGYQLNVRVNNEGSGAIANWAVELQFAEPPQLTNSWNADLAVDGNVVAAQSVSWNARIEPGQNREFGVQGRHDGSFSAPLCVGTAVPNGADPSGEGSTNGEDPVGNPDAGPPGDDEPPGNGEPTDDGTPGDDGTPEDDEPIGPSGRDTFTNVCSACHGADAAGGFVRVALNTPRDRAAMIAFVAANMPQNNPGSCPEACATAVVDYIADTFWEPDTVLACDGIRYGARQLKRLTRSEYQRSVEDLLGVDASVVAELPADAVVGYFANNVQAAVVSSAYDSYLAVAERLAQWSAERNFAGVIDCNGSFDNACASRFMDDFAPRIFRRPLDSSELGIYSELARGTHTNGSVKDGIQVALEAMLSSPQFLYRHELGEPRPDNRQLDADAFELTSHEMASWLSFTYAGTTPDRVALQKAGRDQLRTAAQIMEETERLLANQRASVVMGDFVANWLDTEHLENTPKDEAVWPGFARLVPHLKREVREVFAHVMLDPSERFESLYDADYTFVNGPLAQHYGISGVTGDAFQKVATTNRGGIIANGAFMSRWAEHIESSPIRRSVRVRRRILCQDQPDPPANIALGRERALRDNAGILNDPSTTNRLKYHTITNSEPCVNCHREWINPLGFGMEDFDAVGNVRSVDLNGNPIDATGKLYAPENLDDKGVFIDFVGSKGLGELLTTLESAQHCLPENLFRFIVGAGTDGIDVSNPEGPSLDPDERDGYACEVEDLTTTLLGASPREMLESMSVMDAVRYRKAWAR